MAGKSAIRWTIRLLGWLILLGAVGGGGYYFITLEKPIEVTATQVKRGSVEQTIAAIASGTIMPSRKAMVTGAAIGTIKAVHVDDGDRVDEGDLLVEFDHGELDAQLSLAEANLRVGESRLEQARIAAGIFKEVTAAQLSQARAQWEQTQADYGRIKKLTDKRVVSQSDFDKVALAYRVAAETKTTAEANVKQNLVRQEEIRSGESTLEQFAAGVEVARAARERAYVRAPFSGVVAKRFLEVGEAVAMGLPLLQLVQLDGLYVLAPFDEANAAEIELGQPVRVEVDAYPEESFSGEVYFISPVISLNPDLSRTLELKVRILEGLEKFIPGMSVDVTIITEKHDDVLYAPSESLERDEYAYVIRGGVAHKTAVEIGIGNWESQEVLVGLSEAETIVTSLSVPDLADGALVTVVDELGLE